MSQWCWLEVSRRLEQVLIIDKSDLVYEREVDNATAMRLAKDWRCEYIETSAVSVLSVRNGAVMTRPHHAAQSTFALSFRYPSPDNSVITSTLFLYLKLLCASCGEQAFTVNG